MRITKGFSIQNVIENTKFCSEKTELYKMLYLANKNMKIA